MSRLFLLTLLGCGIMAAQAPPQTMPQTPPQTSSQTTQEQQPLFRTSTEFVQAPVLVFDKDGNYVDGLQPHQFHLFDNGKEQNIQVDVTYQPISMVICIQGNAHVEGLLPQIRRIGGLVSPLLLGDMGEAAVIAFDARVRTLQDFTSDGDKITRALKDLKSGSMSSHMVDGIVAGVSMLKRRPTNRRRIILYIGETRDYGSETHVREALLEMQYANVMFYPVDMSRLLTTLGAKPDPGRQSNLPPAMYPLPGGVPATPTSVSQAYGSGGGGRAEFVPLMVEIFRDVKNIFVDNPIEAFTKGTGGTEYSFYKQRGLEEAIQKIGTELHSQYFVSYTPNNKDEGGFHALSVSVGAYKTQTRPGYWLGAK
jgi:VWFA-related protein